MYSNLNGLKTTKMKITQKEIELIGEYAPSEGVIESDGICFTDEMIIDFAKQYHQEQLKLLNIDNVSVSFNDSELDVIKTDVKHIVDKVILSEKDENIRFEILNKINER